MRILIIEDDTHTREFLLRGLSEAGYAVDSSAEGKQGLFLAMTDYRPSYIPRR